MGLGLYQLARTFADPDIWGYIASGRFYHDTGRIRQPDPFSYVTAGHEWLNFEWLFSLLAFRIFAAVGPPGLIVLKVAIGLAVVGIVYRFLCRQGLPSPRAGILVLIVIQFLVPYFLIVRPHLITYGFFVARPPAPPRPGSRRRAVVLRRPGALRALGEPPSGLPRRAGCAGDLDRRRARAALAREGKARGAGAPLHVGGHPGAGRLCARHRAQSVGVSISIRLLWRTALVPRPELLEWQPLHLGSGQGVSYLLLVVVAAAGWTYSRRPRSLPVLGVLVACALLPLVAWRHVPIAALAIAVLAGEHIGDAWERWSSARPGPMSRAARQPRTESWPPRRR